MREYETTFIVQPEISDEGSQAILAKLDGILETGGATRLMCEDHGKRKLAYEVRKFHKGHYYTLQFLDASHGNSRSSSRSASARLKKPRRVARLKKPSVWLLQLQRLKPPKLLRSPQPLPQLLRLLHLPKPKLPRAKPRPPKPPRKPLKPPKSPPLLRKRRRRRERRNAQASERPRRRFSISAERPRRWQPS